MANFRLRWTRPELLPYLANRRAFTSPTPQQCGTSVIVIRLDIAGLVENKPGKAGEVSPAIIDQRLIVACSASMEDWMPASVDMVKSSISRLTQSS